MPGLFDLEKQGGWQEIFTFEQKPFPEQPMKCLDNTAGCVITVTDTSDADWWQGKSMGRIGFFPSKYVTRLHPGEQPLQVMHTVHVNDGETSIKLLNEQIVIQVGEEKDGVVLIRTGANDKKYACPIKYLKEI